MPLTQILLFSVVTILTVLLLVVGVQVFIILLETRKTIKKVNKILEDANYISSSVAKPVLGVTNFLEGLKSFKHLVELVGDKKTVVKKTPKQEVAESLVETFVGRSPIPQVVEVDERVTETHHTTVSVPQTHIHALQERGRRFFHKGGKPLAS